MSDDLIRKQFEDAFSANFPCTYKAAKAGDSKAHGDMSCAWWGWQSSCDHAKDQDASLRKALADCVTFLERELLQKFGTQAPKNMHPETYRVYCRDMTEMAKFRAFMTGEVGL
ncbi:MULTISPECIES: hypothetical protein [Pseudomonas putida group]|uniref:hypothetical protein n=1 Tax=Pseudomonas putida group TaxID=136845 RepID=UPI001596C35D|nr:MULTISPECIES: hypothetical protein [Pseudomonas putida group]MCZ9636853.1 hypothetical protein [Pseudomonas putida]